LKAVQDRYQIVTGQRGGLRFWGVTHGFACGWCR
jgi:hypothetical protein